MTIDVIPAKSHLESTQSRTEVDGFIDNKDGTSTLVVSCANGKQVRFSIATKRLKSLSVDAIYDVINKECGE